GVILLGNTLYGATSDGGDYDNGTVFAINTDGTQFKTLYSFRGGSDGRGAIIGFFLSSNTLYWAAFSGGSGNGTAFKISTDGTGFTILHEFNGDSDGSVPYGKVLLSSNTLYGTAYQGGGISSNGTVFAMNADGTAFRILHSFTGPP